jgi:hypothetical protein
LSHSTILILAFSLNKLCHLFKMEQFAHPRAPSPLPLQATRSRRRCLTTPTTWRPPIA